MPAVAGVAVQRLAELRRSRRHERWLRGRGAVEHGAGHYPVIVVVHVAWLAATLVEGRRATRPRPFPLAVFAGGQLLRWWAIRSLGRQWTTRVLVDPTAPPVTTGPYRFLDHPNYVAVALEIASLPLAFGARRSAIGASVANAAVLRHRIAVETAARRQLRP